MRKRKTVKRFDQKMEARTKIKVQKVYIHSRHFAFCPNDDKYTNGFFIVSYQRYRITMYQNRGRRRCSQQKLGLCGRRVVRRTASQPSSYNERERERERERARVKQIQIQSFTSKPEVKYFLFFPLWNKRNLDTFFFQLQSYQHFYTRRWTLLEN